MSSPWGKGAMHPRMHDPAYLLRAPRSGEREGPQAADFLAQTRNLLPALLVETFWPLGTYRIQVVEDCSRTTAGGNGIPGLPQKRARRADRNGGVTYNGANN